MHRSTTGPLPVRPPVNSIYQPTSGIVSERSGASRPKNICSKFCLSRCFIVLLVLSLQLAQVPMVGGDFGPLRIHVHFDDTSMTMLTTDNRLLLRRIIHFVTKAFGDILSVDHGNGKLTLKHGCERRESCTSCNDFMIPNTIVRWRKENKTGTVFTNEKTDLLLFVRVKNSSKCRQKLTWWCHSTVCTSTNRPTSGLLTYCPQNISSMHFKALIASTIRHIIVILGFDKSIISDLYPKSPCPLLRKSNFTCATEDDITNDDELLVSTPSVKKFSQTHSGSTTAKGILYSNFDNGWNSMVMFTSLMADSPITDDLVEHLHLDRASLGVLLDSGWYKSRKNISDELLWGRGYGDMNSNASCETGCRMGACNYTDDLKCYQLGVSPQCTVCQNFTQLRFFTSTSCIVTSCDGADKRYDLRCIDGTRKECNKTSEDADCQKFREVCLRPKARSYISFLVGQFYKPWPPDVTTEPTKSPSESTTSPFRHPPQTKKTKKSFRFAFIFAYLDYSIYKMTNDLEKRKIKKHISSTVARILGLPNSTYVQVTDIVSGSTVVHFTVFTEKGSIPSVFHSLHEAIDDGDIYIIINGKKYKATSLKSYDYKFQRGIVTEIIVGTTLGAMLIIGIVSIVIIFVVKKFSRGASVTPATDGPPSDVDSVYRSNSLQTVSVASYTLPYELRLERSSRSVRGVASLRNVSVTELGGQVRQGNNVTEDESNV